MKYLCLRIIYSPDEYPPCQSLIGVMNIEYDVDNEVMMIGCDPDDICVPMTWDTYNKIIELLKIKDVVELKYFGFYYDELSFISMNQAIRLRNATILNGESYDNK